MTLLAMGLSALAAALLVRHGPHRRVMPEGTAGSARGSVGVAGAVPAIRPTIGPLIRPTGPATVALGVAGLVTLLVVMADGTMVGLGLVLLGGGLGMSRLLVISRRRRAGVRREERVLELCEVLASELRAGQPPVTALQHCLDVWPEFAPVAAAARLDADVPACLRAMADQRGAAGLSAVADAWQVSEASGAALSTSLTQVCETVREAQSTRRLITSELASAQATARLMAVLPLAALGLGSGIGGDPWGFLLASPAGLVCLALGLALALLGLWWIERIADGVLRA